MAYLATIWVMLETINIVWPRPAPGVPWYISWSMLTDHPYSELSGSWSTLREDASSHR